MSGEKVEKCLKIEKCLVLIEEVQDELNEISQEDIVGAPFGYIFNEGSLTNIYTEENIDISSDLSSKIDELKDIMVELFIDEKELSVKRINGEMLSLSDIDVDITDTHCGIRDSGERVIRFNTLDLSIPLTGNNIPKEK